jgi:hypothetical protein
VDTTEKVLERLGTTEGTTLVNVMIGLVYQMVGLSWVDYIFITAALVAAVYALWLYARTER